MVRAHRSVNTGIFDCCLGGSAKTLFVRADCREAAGRGEFFF